MSSSQPPGPRPEGPPPAGPPPDAPTPDGPTRDTPTPDAPTPDGPTPDTPTPDAPTPDGPAPDGVFPYGPASADSPARRRLLTGAPAAAADDFTTTATATSTSTVFDATRASTHVMGPPPPPDRELTNLERLELKLLGARRLALGTTVADRRWRWLGPLILVVVAAALRLWNLGRPHSLVFDETYYVKNAATMLKVGYEAAWPDNPNPAFQSGHVDGFLNQPDYVVHPPLGKWMIAAGMKLFGGAENPWAWRISSAIIGIIAVLLVYFVGRRLFASTAMGLVAGGLMAVDGEAIVHSRTGLLDNFLMFWVLLAFVFLLLDREQARRRLAAKCAAILDAGGEIGRYGPRLGWRWWRFAAAVALGLSCGVKWSGIYFFAVFAVVSVLWDATARRKVGIKRWWEDAFLVDALPAALIMIPTAALTYLGTWTSWFLSDNSYMRHWAEQNPGQGVSWLPPALRSLWQYHLQMWQFHNGLTTPHDYAANPFGWILQWRPTSFYWQKWNYGQHGCTSSDGCAQAITSIGNPLIWWAGAVALIVAIVLLVWKKDWRAGAVLSGIAAGWVPWFAYAHRTIFTFYSIAFTPWVVLTVTYVIAYALERTEHRPFARRRVRIATGVFLAAVGVLSVFWYPIWTAMQVPYWFWHIHMWLPSWI